MKTLTLIVYADVKQILADTLRGLKQVQGFTFTHVEGHGTQDSRDPMLSARDHVVGYVPHIRVDVILEDKHVGDVLDALRNSQCGLAGRGRYWITEVESLGRL
jgi:nitrogen regulatory protein P-II 1